MFTQNFSQFDIHARALLGMPLPEIKINQSGASRDPGEENASGNYIIDGVKDALEDKNVDYRIFETIFKVRLSNGCCFSSNFREGEKGS